jgi:hypothetical protein
VQTRVGAMMLSNAYINTAVMSRGSDVAAREVTLYDCDAVVRRATALQLTHEARQSQEARA